jgi:hypothetical protein
LFPGKAKKKTKPKLRLPCKPDTPLGSLSSVALSCVAVKQDYYTTDLALSFQTILCCPILGVHFTPGPTA